MADAERPTGTTGFEIEVAVLDALATNGGMTAIELGDAIDADPVTVDQVCYQLQREDSVRMVTRGEYLLTHHGQQRLDNHRLMDTTQ